MPFNPEALLERARLKARVRRWRFIALVIGAVLLGTVTGSDEQGGLFGKDYIALVEIKGIINVDEDEIKTLEALAENTHVKAVLMLVDSPGGTAVGGEVYYDALTVIQQKKPLVAMFSNMATSAAYLIATPADHIVARKATITGSIGALIQVPNVKGLTDKIGVGMNTIKTGPLKGEPDPFGEMSDASRQVLQGMVDDFQTVFVSTIAQHRKIPIEQVKAMADGRVFTGQQAMANHLVDELGGQKQAVAWLEQNKKLPKELDVVKVPLKKSKNDLKKWLESSVFGDILLPKSLSLNGLLSIWQNGGM